tara:strand:- start:14505 stop:16382 length:1878 start_codon:yes stop_codon:yes gene_type:complete
MKNLKIIGEELFNKIRGRFPTVSTGDESGKVTSDPKKARFFEFDYRDNDDPLGKVTVSLNDEDGLTVMFNSNMLDDGNEVSKDNWYSFLRELRGFAKKRLLNFDTRDIERSNLKKRDYAQLAQTEAGDNDMMAENKMYGTSRTSYQDVGQARLMLKHKAPVNQELPAGRTQRVESIFIESPTGERFKYPFKHLGGARAMARHVSEGGLPHDTFGAHITGLSEELANLKKFKTYMGRSSVMAESLSGYMDVVKERVSSVKDRVAKLQKENYYKEAIDTYEGAELTEVPENIQSDWIAELTIKQFNEELKDVFPYIYKLIGEAAPKEVNLESDEDDESVSEKSSEDADDCLPEEAEFEAGLDAIMGEWAEDDDDGLEENSAWDSHNTDVSRDKTVGQRYAVLHIKSGKKTPFDTLDDANDMFKKLGGTSKGLKVIPETGEAATNDHGQQTPVTEYILSMFDRDAGKFPKGETAILTAIEKDYGESYITPAKEFIGRLNELCAQHGEYAEDMQTSEARPSSNFAEFESTIELDDGTEIEVTIEIEGDEDQDGNANGFYITSVTGASGNEVDYSPEDEKRFYSEVENDMHHADAEDHAERQHSSRYESVNNEDLARIISLSGMGHSKLI